MYYFEKYLSFMKLFSAAILLIDAKLICIPLQCEKKTSLDFLARNVSRRQVNDESPLTQNRRFSS